MLASFANGQWLICSSRSVVGIVAVIKKLLLIPPASENFSICAGQRNSIFPRSKTEERGNLSVRRLGRSWICVNRASREIDWETRERSSKRSFLQWPRATRQI